MKQWRFGFLVVATLSLTGCETLGSIPNPFKGISIPFSTAPAPQNELLRISDGIGVHVSAPKRLDDHLGEPLAEAISDALLKRNIPAFTGPQESAGYALAGRARPDSTTRSGEGIHDIRWFLFGPDGTQIAEFESVLDSSDQTRQMAADDLATEVALLLQDSDASIAPVAPPKARIYLRPVSGVNKDGAQALERAFKRLIESSGGVMAGSEAEATMIVESRFKVSAPRGDKQRVRVSWIAYGPKGGEMGQINQVNDIPKGRLDKPWGALAYAIASGGVEGVGRILDSHNR